MKINRTGITRIVFIFKSVVIKIPNFSYSWQHFLCGLIANIKEGNAWHYNKFYPEVLELMCPIVWKSWGGWILVMKKADTERWYHEIISKPSISDPNDWQCIKENNELTYKKWIDAGLGGDDKTDNYGYYKHRLVKIDYGS